MKTMNKKIALLVTAVLMCILCAFPAAASNRFEQSNRAYWDEDVLGMARWDKVDNAKVYEVRLYEGEILVKSIENHGGTRLDLREYMEDGGSYSFKVRAIPTKSQRSYTSGLWTASDEITAAGVGTNDGRWRTYLQGRKYQLSDGSYFANGWKQIAARWYFFGEDQYAKTGWQQINSVWYYFNAEAVMQTGWQEVEGNWYYLDQNGGMQTGWIETKPGQWYYLNESGAMLSNTVVDGYQLGENGMCIN